jgi:hypothetical protein
MIFPTWSQNTIQTKNIPIDSELVKKQPEQLQFNFNEIKKVGFYSDFSNEAYIELANKLLKKISPLKPLKNPTSKPLKNPTSKPLKNPTSSSLTLQELINKEVFISDTLFAKSDSTQLLYSEGVEVQNYCNYYGINPHNVRSIKVEIEQGTFIHKVTIEKEIF